jgi:hypothetical protein
MTPKADSVSPELFGLSRTLAAMDAFRPFCLGGGTSLALRFGHRRSVDLDFFCIDAFDSNLCQSAIAAVYPDAGIINRTSGSLCVVIRGIKVDILYHPYPLIGEIVPMDAFKLMSLPDMAAMKINAVTNRGSKKDFSDLLLLHEQGLTLPEALDCFFLKYGDAGRFLAIRSLNWFEDAETEPDPVYLNGWNWQHVRTEMARLAKGLVV